MVALGTVPLPAVTLSSLMGRFGGILPTSDRPIVALAAIEVAKKGELAAYTSLVFRAAAEAAIARGAVLLALPNLAMQLGKRRVWVHPHAAWVFSSILGEVRTPLPEPVIGRGTVIEPGAIVMPGSVIGRRVRIGAGTVIGREGFGFVESPSGELLQVPHVGGVIIEDDVSIGALCTIDAGVLLPTRIGAMSKLDAQVHVGHNVVLGNRVRVAAQSGFAGSVHVGHDVLVGGQVGVADHVSIGDGARIAAKAGVIGDVAAGSTVAGYPAVPRVRWLRGQARLYGKRGSLPED